MTKTPMTNQAIPLSQLAIHPANVRASSTDTYTQDNTAHLRASIAVQGLIQPLTVQKIGKTYGVLAGGRRLFSLQTLAADAKAKGISSKTKIDCRVVPEDCDAPTALSLAENITHEPMSPIDEFEAFARMMQVDGQTPATIAMTFGTTEAAVKGRLRYGLVHEDIRAAVRAKTLTLDAMKAFADHPSQEVQLEVYQALTTDGDRPAAHQVRSALKTRGVQVSDDLGGFVRDAYEARGGAIARDLIDEHSVLEDMALVQEVLRDQLLAAAEAERAKHGFAWADAATDYTWDMFSEFERVYPVEIEPCATASKLLGAITANMETIENRLETEELDYDAHNALSEQFDALEAEASALSEAYTDDDLARAGVFAVWQHGEVRLTLGLVRPEDVAREDSGPEASDTEPATDKPAPTADLAASLKDDLKTERAVALGAALAQSPELAQDLALFKLATDVLGGGRQTYAIDVHASQKYRTHAKKDEIDTTAEAQMQAVFEALEMGWNHPDTPSDVQFAQFRALDADQKARITAYVLGLTTEPSAARHPISDPIMYAIEQQIMPDVRAHWAPNAALFNRLKKAALLDILSVELGLVQEALNLAGSSKREVVDFMDQLFRDPFATLTSEQRAAVEAWAPEMMRTAFPEPDPVEDTPAETQIAA